MATKVFVTGGTGFIGSHLVEALLARGNCEVRCLIRTNPKWLAGLDILPVHGTLFDTDLVRAALHDVDYVFHIGGVTRARTWEAFNRENVEATQQLLRCIHHANPTLSKVVLASSLAAVGPTQSGMADESAPLRPVTRYGRSKADMEQSLRIPDSEGRVFQRELPVVVVRPPAVYGPRERDILTFFKSVNSGICPIVRGIGGLSLVHVRDLVRGILQAAMCEITSGETYFIGSNEVYSWEHLYQAVTSVLGRRALKVFVPRRLVRPIGALSELAGMVVGTYPPLNREKAREILWATKICSSAKARRDFGYRQDVSLMEGMRATLAWYRQTGMLS